MKFVQKFSSPKGINLIPALHKCSNLYQKNIIENEPRTRSKAFHFPLMPNLKIGIILKHPPNSPTHEFWSKLGLLNLDWNPAWIHRTGRDKRCKMDGRSTHINVRPLEKYRVMWIFVHSFEGLPQLCHKMALPSYLNRKEILREPKGSWPLTPH